jgi:hypothetical protein
LVDAVFNARHHLVYLSNRLVGLRLPVIELVLIRLGLGLLGGHFGLVVFALFEQLLPIAQVLVYGVSLTLVALF